VSLDEEVRAEPAARARERAVGVRLEGVVKDYGTSRALFGLDLDVRPGELVSLLGPSGCGKTTALRVIAGLERADGGAVLFDGEDVSRIPANKRDLGMVFQSYSLFPHLDVLRNTMYGLATRRVERGEAGRRAAAALDLVGLADFSARYPHQLSGGQQQRVALARALVTEPRVLLLDEPLSALDARVRVQVREEIRSIQLRLGITTVFVTHDQEEALAVSDRVAVMVAGRIEQVGTPEELYRQPATAAVAEFVGRSNRLPATVVGGRAEVLGTTLPLLIPRADGPAVVYVRPEHLRIASSGLSAVVRESVFLGAVRRTRLETSDGLSIWMQHDAGERLGLDEGVRVTVQDQPVAAGDPEPLPA
jgi:putative spermidine/putrescine transport system ATP-binding protein